MRRDCPFSSRTQTGLQAARSGREGLQESGGTGGGTGCTPWGLPLHAEETVLGRFVSLDKNKRMNRGQARIHLGGLWG